MKQRNEFQYPGGFIYGTGLIDLKSKTRETLHLERVLKAIKGKRGRLLDIGCGGGQYSRTIYRLMKDRFNIYACDIEERAIEQNKIIAKKLNEKITYSVADIQNLPYEDKKFDVVLILDVLEHVYYPEKTLAEVCRVLKDDGIFFCYVPCENNHFIVHWFLWSFRIGYNIKLKNGGHIQRFNIPELKQLVRSSGFKIKKENYEMGYFGQMFDFLIFSILSIKSIARYAWRIRKDPGTKTKKSLLSKFLILIKNTIYFIIYYESKFIDWLHVRYFALGIYLTCIKQKDDN